VIYFDLTKTATKGEENALPLPL